MLFKYQLYECTYSQLQVFECYKSFIWDPYYVLYAYYGLLSPGYVYFAPTKLGGRYLPPKKAVRG